ncbi:MAG: hypothetical protein FWH11_13990 [Micrococcales bacterium]|nr:hypothetical protein [Micrococcales bacterium]
MTGGAVVDPPRQVFDIADHEDNLVMGLAVATAAILVGDDTDLTALSPWRGRTPVLRPREFVARTLQPVAGGDRAPPDVGDTQVAPYVFTSLIGSAGFDPSLRPPVRPCDTSTPERHFEESLWRRSVARTDASHL